MAVSKVSEDARDDRYEMRLYNALVTLASPSACCHPSGGSSRWSVARCTPRTVGGYLVVQQLMGMAYAPVSAPR